MDFLAESSLQIKKGEYSSGLRADNVDHFKHYYMSHLSHYTIEKQICKLLFLILALYSEII